jgi:fatty-acyl-CoA synthase
VILSGESWQALSDAGWQGDRAVLAEKQAALSPDDPINIQYTSGTTGFPKGATLSHHNILNNGFFVGEPCDYDHNDCVCICVHFCQ